MLDLETLGTKHGSVIIAIGAVVFTDKGLGEEFYLRVDPADCQTHGLKIDAATVFWWMNQNDDARREVTKPGEPLTVALDKFSEFVITSMPYKVWGNGSNFDNALLRAAYEATGMPTPWKFYADACYRTVKGLVPEIPITNTGAKHNALDDAKSQALHLIKIRSTF